tara:strand:+ start:439 stop:1008 length:570 start_codon:yes stop_codon:yes gene_type:complete
MNEFYKVESPIVETDVFKIENPKIIERINNDITGGKPFHYIFFGTTGVGKTYLGTHISIKCEERWEMLSCISHYKEHISFINSDYTDKMEADRKNDNKFSSNCLMIDDLGDEKPTTPASHDYFSGLLEKRYLYIKRNNISRTIITTNLKSEEIIAMYGSRVYDRICEHFIICKFNNDSFRKKNLQIIKG